MRQRPERIRTSHGRSLGARSNRSTRADNTGLGSRDAGTNDNTGLGARDDGAIDDTAQRGVDRCRCIPVGVWDGLLRRQLDRIGFAGADCFARATCRRNLRDGHHRLDA